MDEVTCIVLASLMRSRPAKEQEELSAHLSKHAALEVKGSAKSFRDPFMPLSPLHFVHPSWIAPILRTLTEGEIHLFLSCLEPAKADMLRSALLLKKVEISPSDFSAEYFHRWLWQQLSQATPHLLPMPCLPESPLNDLLLLSDDELSNLINLLAMHDVNTEIRHIIETAKLKHISQALSKEQQQYLLKIKQKKEKVVFKPINLANWSGNAIQLKTLLRHRGMNRLAKALNKEHPSLIWYVKHRLNTEEAALFEKLLDNLHNLGATQALKQDLIALVATLPKSHLKEAG